VFFAGFTMSVLHRDRKTRFGPSIDPAGQRMNVFEAPIPQRLAHCCRTRLVGARAIDNDLICGCQASDPFINPIGLNKSRARDVSRSRLNLVDTNIRMAAPSLRRAVELVGGNPIHLQLRATLPLHPFEGNICQLRQWQLPSPNRPTQRRTSSIADRNA
jgi:hypothetical protein